jgi:hypothetical protein
LLTGPVGSVPEVLVAYISLVTPSSFLPSDILLDPAAVEHGSTNRKTTSVLRLHQLATIHVRSIVRRPGVLSAARATSSMPQILAIA